MPQEIDCRLTVEGPAQPLESFYARLFAKGWDPDRALDVSFCATFVPVPQQLASHFALREWKLANWGSIDGDGFVYAISLRKLTDSILSAEIDFTSINSPPTQVVQTLRTMFPTLTFTLETEEE